MAILDTGFVLDVEKTGASSSEGAPSSDDPVATRHLLEPSYGSDDIEVINSLASTTHTDEEDEPDARFVDGSLDLICSPTPTNVLKRPVAALRQSQSSGAFFQSLIRVHYAMPLLQGHAPV